MAKVSPWTGSKNLPPLEMKSLRALVLKVWRMELVQKGLFILDDDPDDLLSIEVPDLEIPLSGLQVKLVDLTLQMKLIGEYAEQVLNPDDDPDDPLYLIRQSQMASRN